jgi:molybdopterin-guanine dinucleotide biosynthesis protein A
VTPPRLVGAVLCGGSSTRMGADKALLAIGGRPMALRVAAALRAAGASRVIAVGGDAPALSALGLDVVPDRWPGEGPLGGILTALGELEHPETEADVVAVLACDLVDPDPATIRAVVERLTTAGAAPPPHVAVPVSAGRRHFHHAVWHRRAREPLERAFAAGERAPRRAAHALAVVEVEGLDAATLRDADDPAALARARAALGALGGGPPAG